MRGAGYAAAITALMTGEAYAQSARIARDHGGPFTGYAKNRDPFLRVMHKHRDAMGDIDSTYVPKSLYDAAKDAWDDAVDLGEDHGYRNAQATVLAPTGDDRVHDGLRHDRASSRISPSSSTRSSWVAA